MSGEALALVDRFAAQEGLSRSAWFERAVLRAKRRSGVARAVSLARRSGIPAWVDVTPHLAKRAGRAHADAGAGPSAVDALVATVAAAFGDIVLTSDPEDFEQLKRHYPGLRALGV